MNALLRPVSVLAVLTLALAASADQIVYDLPIDSNTFQNNLFIDAFDPGLGTLTSVNIDLDVHNVGSVSTLNLGTPVGVFEQTTRTYGYIQIEQPYVDDNVFYYFGNYFALAAGEYNGYTLGPLGTGETMTSDLSYVGGINVGYETDEQGYQIWNTSGMFTGAALTRFVARFDGDKTRFNYGDKYFYTQSQDLPNSTVTLDFDGFTNLKVTYNYTPVPEPASLAVLGLGALALLRRRRK